MRRPDTRRRNGQLVRVLRLMRTLETGRWTLVAIRADLGITKRTLYRDLAALREAGLPLMTTREAGAGRVWWLARPELARTA